MSAGHVNLRDTMPLRVDPTGTTLQPVTLAAPLPAGIGDVDILVLLVGAVVVFLLGLQLGRLGSAQPPPRREDVEFYWLPNDAVALALYRKGQAAKARARRRDERRVRLRRLLGMG